MPGREGGGRKLCPGIRTIPWASIALVNIYIVDKFLKCDIQVKAIELLLPCGTVYCAVQGTMYILLVLTVWSMDKII